MYRELIKMVEGLGRPRILVVGDLILDRYVFGDAERISPEAPIQVLRVDYEETRLGGAGAVVNNLRTLGADVEVFGVVGTDPDGEHVLAELGRIGAGTDEVLRSPDRPTTRKTRFVGRAQHRIPQQVLRVDWEQPDDLSDADQSAVVTAFERSLTGHPPGAVLLSDYGKGVLTAGLTARLIEAAAAAEPAVPVIVDPLKSADYGKYRGATVLTPNRDEAQTASGVPLAGDDASALERAAAGLVGDVDLDALVITLDKAGAYLRRRGEAAGALVPTRPRHVYDNAGAGDMVVAVMALALAGGTDFREAVQLANVAGGLEVEKFGVQPVTREEMVLDLLGEARRSGDKVRSTDGLLADLSRHRARGETVVFTNGCFDILHAGHIEYLAFASRQGDVLVVGLNSDRSVRSIKGPERPVCPQDQRARVLSAIEAIDYIVLFDEDTPQRLIEAVRPDVLVKGEDWRDKGVVGREFVESHGGRVVLAPLVEGLSTTDLVSRIRENGAAEGSKGDAP
ncbi:MAG: D-glycero-beta-D-manno-heptose 1-phosphate adenylyltransferase [Phycisphaerae bacterium]